MRNIRIAGLAAWIAGSVSCPSSAFADMIVMASTVPSIAVNQMLPAGTEIVVPEGGSVTLIDIHQNTVEIKAPGGIVPGGSDEASAGNDSGSFIDMLRRFFAPEAAPKLGATRSAKLPEPPSCATLPQDLTILFQNNCEERALEVYRAMQSRLDTSLFLGTSKGTGTVTYRLGETIELEAQANFDAFLYCFHESSDGMTTRFIPFVGSTPRLNANAVGRLPGSLANDDFFIAAGAPMGTDKIHCFATEYDIAPQFPNLLAGEPFLGQNMMETLKHDVFGQVGTRVAEAELVVEVYN